MNHRDGPRYRMLCELVKRLEHDPACVMTYIASGKVEKLSAALDAEIARVTNG